MPEIERNTSQRNQLKSKDANSARTTVLHSLDGEHGVTERADTQITV